MYEKIAFFRVKILGLKCKMGAIYFLNLKRFFALKICRFIEIVAQKIEL